MLLEQALGLHGQGRLDEAERVYVQILTSDPQHVQARHMQGVIRAQQGRHAEAREILRPIVEADPYDALALANYANVLAALGQAHEALQCLDGSLAIEPRYADAWRNRGDVLQTLSRLDEAISSYDRALALVPNSAATLCCRGDAQQKQRRYDLAIADYEQAIAFDPRWLEAHTKKSDALQRLCRYEEALTGYDQAIAIDPYHAGAWNNRGVALQNLKRLDSAKASFARAAELAPNTAEIRVNQALVLLLQQDFAAGWPLFEWLKEMPSSGAARRFSQPEWTGAEDIKGKTLFAHIHKGLGDAIQFYRYAVLAQARGAEVILSVNDPLLPLLGAATPKIQLLGAAEIPDHFDYHVFLMSMPLALGVDIPKTDRYLAADPARKTLWEKRLGKHGYRIGVAWQGDAAVLGAEGKSFPLAALAEIAGIPGVRLINLQKNAGAEQLRDLPPGMKVETFAGFDEGRAAFLDSAAIIENLDLVISSDTAIAHLAGALGAANWMALKYVPEWRWFLDRADTPWYPRTRLFRQSRPGDWGAVFSAMEEELRQVVPNHAGGQT